MNKYLLFILVFFSYLILGLFIAATVTFLNPSVSEAVMPNLGECDIVYNDVLIPCISWTHAFLINLIISLIGLFVIFVLHWLLYNKGYENGK